VAVTPAEGGEKPAHIRVLLRTSIFLSHLTLAIPYQPGAISRSGNTWDRGSGAPIHLITEQVVRVHGIRKRHAPGEPLGALRLFPPSIGVLAPPLDIVSSRLLARLVALRRSLRKSPRTSAQRSSIEEEVWRMRHFQVMLLALPAVIADGDPSS